MSPAEKEKVVTKRKDKSSRPPVVKPLRNPERIAKRFAIKGSPQPIFVAGDQGIREGIFYNTVQEGEWIVFPLPLAHRAVLEPIKDLSSAHRELSERVSHVRQKIRAHRIHDRVERFCATNYQELLKSSFYEEGTYVDGETHCYPELYIDDYEVQSYWQGHEVLKRPKGCGVVDVAVFGPDQQGFSIEIGSGNKSSQVKRQVLGMKEIIRETSGEKNVPIINPIIGKYHYVHNQDPHKRVTIVDFSPPHYQFVTQYLTPIEIGEPSEDCIAIDCLYE